MMRVSKGKTKSDIYFQTYSPSRFDAAIIRSNVFMIWDMVASIKGRLHKFRKTTSYQRLVAGVRSGYFTMNDFYAFADPRTAEVKDRRKKHKFAGYMDEDMLVLIFTAYVDAGHEQVISMLRGMYKKQYLGYEADKYLDILYHELRAKNEKTETLLAPT